MIESGDPLYDTLVAVHAEVGGVVFRHEDDYYQRIQDNDVVKFALLPQEDDRNAIGHRHIPKWYKYHGPYRIGVYDE